MEELLLSDGLVRVTLKPDNNQAVLCISKEDDVCFPVTKHNLSSILEGETIQFAVKGIFCKLARFSDDIRVVYAWKGLHNSALFPAEQLACLLEMLDS